MLVQDTSFSYSSLNFFALHTNENKKGQCPQHGGFNPVCKGDDQTTTYACGIPIAFPIALGFNQQHADPAEPFAFNGPQRWTGCWNPFEGPTQPLSPLDRLLSGQLAPLLPVETPSAEQLEFGPTRSPITTSPNQKSGEVRGWGVHWRVHIPKGPKSTAPSSAIDLAPSAPLICIPRVHIKDML